MKDGLLDEIKRVGHWRVNIRPTRPIAEKLGFSQCTEIVEKHRVQIRGWDYPHMSRRNDDQGSLSRGEDFVESWCDWDSFKEFWRMFRSGQFLSYNALHEDLGGYPDVKRDGLFLDVLSTVYSVTEFVEFSNRVYSQPPFGEGFSIQISLENTDGRSLIAGRGRMPFFERKDTAAKAIRIEREHTTTDISSGGAPELALSILLELFDFFGWNPEPRQIRSDQEAFYQRRFG